MLKNKRILIILILALAALTLSSCVGGSRRVTASGWSGSLVDGDTVYFSNGPFAYAINADTGGLKWQFPAEQERGLDFYATPVLADEGEQLLVPGYNNILYSVDPASGIEKWAFAQAGNRYIASPLVTEDGIFAPNSDNTVYALDFNGVLQWTYTTDDPLWASPIWSENCGCIYQVSMDRTLHAIDPDTGKSVWQSVDLGGPVVSKPAVSEDGLIVISTFNNEVVALDEESHEIVWRFPTQNWAWASPVVDGEQVYVSDISGNFYALELATGQPAWQVQPGGGIFTAPLVKDDLIYISTDASSLVVLSREGVIQRNQPIDGKLYASPVAAGEKVILTPTDAEFFVIALSDSGVQIWGYPPPN